MIKVHEDHAFNALTITTEYGTAHFSLHYVQPTARHWFQAELLQALEKLLPPPTSQTPTPETSPLAEYPADLDAAISVIESCNGFTDETSAVGEAWQIVKKYLRLTSAYEPNA